MFSFLFYVTFTLLKRKKKFIFGIFWCLSLLSRYLSLAIRLSLALSARAAFTCDLRRRSLWHISLSLWYSISDCGFTNLNNEGSHLLCMIFIGLTEEIWLFCDLLKMLFPAWNVCYVKPGRKRIFTLFKNGQVRFNNLTISKSKCF